VMERKSKERQGKRTVSRQLRLFKTEWEARAETEADVKGGSKQDVAELLSRLSWQRDSTCNILEEIVSEKNMYAAYRQVRRNKGSGGIDGESVETFGANLELRVQKMRTELLGEQYVVSAVRKVEIPKPDGGVRLLGIPTVQDRIVQQAIQQVLSRYYDQFFSESSYGFRPNRGAHDAIMQSARYVEDGYEWVVDIDLEKFFDKINHDRLMQRLSKGISDQRLLRLINNFLKAGLMNEGLMEQRTSGTPQGGPLSPLLSNIVLDELDKELEKRGHKFCRYADDCNIYVKSEKAGERVLESISKFIEEKLKLKVNLKKSGVRHCTKVKFLGYTILEKGEIRVADKSKEKLKEKAREITGRSRGKKFEDVIMELNEMIIGWAAYFNLATRWLSDFKEIDGWIRRRLRLYRLKMCKKKYTMFKFLSNLGGTERASWNAIMYSQGWWELSNKQVVKQSMNLKWFHELGLLSIESELSRRKR
jgi:RNA-directed DNA polymerase